MDAALELERLSQLGSVAGLATDHGSVEDSVTSAGGVHVTQSLLDRDDEAISNNIGDNYGYYTDPDDASVALSGNASSDTEMETGTARGYGGWPAVSESGKRKAKQQLGSTIEGLDALNLGSDKASGEERFLLSYSCHLSYNPEEV